MRKSITALAALLLLSACSSQPAQSEPASEPSAASQTTQEATSQPIDAAMPGKLSPGTFTFTSINGGTGVIEMPANPPADLAHLETGGVDFLAVDVDNRKGSEDINMYSVNIYDEAGKEYSYVRETDWMDEQEGPSVDDTEAYNAQVDLYNSYLDNVSAGERRTVYMVGPTVPGEFVVVSVEPTGQMEEPVSAVPVK